MATGPKLKKADKAKIKDYVLASPADKKAKGETMMLSLESKLTESYLDGAMNAAKTSEAAVDAFLATIEEEP